MGNPLTLHQILDGPEWLSVTKAYEQYSQIENFDGFFERPHGIHGVRHARRVLFHTLMISSMCGLDEPDRELLVSAALYHDIGRDNDGLCFRHGKLSVEKMTALNLVPAGRENGEMLKFVVTYHCIDDSKALAELKVVPEACRERTRRLFNVLKDADGLDRVRIGDLDVKYLRNPESVRLEKLAYELFARI